MKLTNNLLMKDDCGHGENCCCSPKTWKDQFISLVLIICNFVFSGCTVSVLMWKQRLSENYEKNILLFCLKFMKKNIMLFCLKFYGKYFAILAKIYVFDVFFQNIVWNFVEVFVLLLFPFYVIWLLPPSAHHSGCFCSVISSLNYTLKTVYCHINIDYVLMIRLSSWLTWKWISSII